MSLSLTESALLPSPPPLLQDRVLILRRVTIEAECTIGSRTVVEAGVVMHRGSQGEGLYITAIYNGYI